MLLKLANENRTEKDVLSDEDKKEFQKFILQKKRQSSTTNLRSKSIVDIYGQSQLKKPKLLKLQPTGAQPSQAEALSPRRAVDPVTQQTDLKKEFDQLAYESSVGEARLLRLQRELEKLREQRRDVCTPNQIQENERYNQHVPYGWSRIPLNLSMRSQHSFSQSSLVKHTSAIFDNEKLEAKVDLLLQLITEAEEKNKWERFDYESYEHLAEGLKMQKKFDETKIYSLMPEYKSMAKLGENTERLKFLANSASLIAQNGIVQCYTKMKERVEHRIEKVGEKNDIFKEEEATKQRMVEERINITRNIKAQEKKLKKLRNINERLKFTEDEKQEIERRTRKEVFSIKNFEALIALQKYLETRVEHCQDSEIKQSDESVERLEEVFHEYTHAYAVKKRDDIFGQSLLSQTNAESSFDRTFTARVRSAHRSPDRSAVNRTTTLNQTLHQQQSLASKMRQYFRKKIDQELRVKKWREINHSEPQMEFIVDQMHLGQFRLNSTKQTFDTLQTQVKDKRKALTNLEETLAQYRKDIHALKQSKQFDRLISHDESQDLVRARSSEDEGEAMEEEHKTVNLLIQKIEMPPKQHAIKLKHHSQLKYKFEIECYQTEILVRMCYRLSQLKLIASDSVVFEFGTTQILGEYDLISKAFGLGKPPPPKRVLDDTLEGTHDNTQSTVSLAVAVQPQKAQTHREAQDPEQLALIKAVEQRKKQFIKKTQHSQAATSNSGAKKPAKVNKQNFASNFDVMKFLKRVLATKVEESDDHHKRMMAKYRVIISQMKSLLGQQSDHRVEITDDLQALSFGKYQSMVQEALRRKYDKETRNLTLNLTMGSLEEEHYGAQQNERTFNQSPQMGYSQQKKLQEEQHLIEEESKGEVEYLNTTRADTKQSLRSRLELQLQAAARPKTPSNDYGKQVRGYDAEKFAYQKEVKEYRTVMQNFQRQETIFIQKFKKGQDSVYTSIMNPNSLRTHKANLYKLFDRSKSTISSKPNAAEPGSKNSTPFKKQGAKSLKLAPSALNITARNKAETQPFGLEKMQEIQKQVNRHEKILFNLYGKGTPLIGHGGHLQTRPMTARAVFKNSILHNESILKDTLVLPLGNAKANHNSTFLRRQLNQNASTAKARDGEEGEQRFAYRVEFGYDKDNFGEYLDKEGNLRHKSRPVKQFAVPLELVKKAHEEKRNQLGSRNRSIFTQNYMTQQNLPQTGLRPSTALPRK